MDIDHSKIARALYDALIASADHCFVGSFDMDDPVTIDGNFDLPLAADILVERLAAIGFALPSPPTPRQSG